MARSRRNLDDWEAEHGLVIQFHLPKTSRRTYWRPNPLLRVKVASRSGPHALLAQRQPDGLDNHPATQIGSPTRFAL